MCGIGCKVKRGAEVGRKCVRMSQVSVCGSAAELPLAIYNLK
jgi:hypothetical protein